MITGFKFPFQGIENLPFSLKPFILFAPEVARVGFYERFKIQRELTKERGRICDLCFIGPCSIDIPAKGSNLCGLERETIELKKVLRAALCSASFLKLVLDDVISILGSIAGEARLSSLKDLTKLKALSLRFNIPDILPDEEIILSLLNHITSDHNRAYGTPSYLVQTFAPKERILSWTECGIFPGGLINEAMVGMRSCPWNSDAEPRSILKKALRVAIATTYECQLVLNYLLDSVFGTPSPGITDLGLGSLDGKYVNIVFTGSNPLIGFAICDLSKEDEWHNLCGEKGASGIRIFCFSESSLEVIERYREKGLVHGFIGGKKEGILDDPIIDLIVGDMNPLVLGADSATLSKSKIFYVSESKPDFQDSWFQYRLHELQNLARIVLERAVENFSRRGCQSSRSGYKKREGVIGFSTESLFDILGGKPDLLIESLVSGKLKGIALFLSPILTSTLPPESTLELAIDLLRKDFLILSLGSSNEIFADGDLFSKDALAYAGFGLRAICDYLQIPPVLSFGPSTEMGRIAELLASLSSLLLNTPIRNMPFLAISSEYADEMSILNLLSSLSLGLTSFHFIDEDSLSSLPVLFREIKGITGGNLKPVFSIQAAAESIEEFADEKRKNLK